MKNIIFDLDGVIRYIKNPKIRDVLSSDIVYKTDETLTDFVLKYLPMECFKMWDKGVVDVEYVVNEVSKVAEEPKKVVKALLNAPLKVEYNGVYNETVDLINKLFSRGYNLYILSNMCKEIVDILPLILDMNKFKDSLFSCNVGVRKPDEEIYKLALKQFKIKAEDSIFIDDNIKNLKPFEDLGGKIFLFDNKNVADSVKELYQTIKNENQLSKNCVSKNS